MINLNKFTLIYYKTFVLKIIKINLKIYKLCKINKKPIVI